MKQVLFAEFVANIGPEFSFILAYTVQGLGASLLETMVSFKNTQLRVCAMDMWHHVVKAKANIQANLFFRLSNFGTLEHFEIRAPKVFIPLQLLIRRAYLFIQPTTNLSSLMIILSYFNANKIIFVSPHLHLMQINFRD